MQRENILFGQPFNEDRYWEVIKRACLLPDLQVLPDGDLTEVNCAFRITTFTLTSFRLEKEGSILAVVRNNGFVISLINVKI
jgi:hypothetical protein